MTVYAVYQGFEYEGISNVTLFDTEAKANAFAAESKAEDFYDFVDVVQLPVN